MRVKLGQNLTFHVTFLNPIAVDLTNVVIRAKMSAIRCFTTIYKYITILIIFSDSKIQPQGSL